MALQASTLTGSAWVNAVLGAMKTVQTTLKGLPIKMTTRAVPTHLDKLRVENKNGVLLESFLSIPLYTDGGDTANKLTCMLPNGSETEISLTQE